jgi:hypothetical protein
MLSIPTDITRLTSTNIEAGKEPLKGPMNTFVSAAAYPPGDLKLVVRINFDTLYSLGWLDLTKEPVVVSSPEASELFDRSAGLATRSARPSHQGFQAPQGYPAYRRAHPLRRGRGRTKTDGRPDYDAVHKIQAGYKITPLSQWASRPSW